MKKIFSVSKLKEIVHPDNLEDVLKVLKEGGLVEEWDMNYLGDMVEISIPKNVEIREVMIGFEKVIEDGKKRRMH